MIVLTTHDMSASKLHHNVHHINACNIRVEMADIQFRTILSPMDSSFYWRNNWLTWAKAKLAALATLNTASHVKNLCCE